MRRLFPAPRPDETSVTPETLEALAEVYAYPAGGPDGRPWLRANMVSSLDGAAWHEGRSKPLSSEADMRIFGVLRGLADAVIVGAETVRKEGYRPARARDAFAERRAALGQSPAPAIAVVSAGLDLDFSLPLFTEPSTPTLLLTGAKADPERMRAARAVSLSTKLSTSFGRIGMIKPSASMSSRIVTKMKATAAPRADDVAGRVPTALVSLETPAAQ